jgi:hypothetical protein
MRLGVLIVSFVLAIPAAAQFESPVVSDRAADPAPADPAPLYAFPRVTRAEANGQWPGMRYSDVRAYAYDGREGLAPLVTNGKLGPTVLKKSEVRLSTQQIERLLKAHRNGNWREISACWSPHHGFVFYSTRGKAVAWVEVCFTCSGTRESPDSGPGFDIKALRRLCEELKLPNLPKKT